MMKRFFLALALVAGLTPVSAQTRDWVTTWATALQIAEPHNRPPKPGLAGNSFRQIVQVSIGGKALRLHLSNLFNPDPTQILGVEIAGARESAVAQAPEPAPAPVAPPEPPKPLDAAHAAFEADGDPRRMREEALDVMATCIRLINLEMPVERRVKA